MDEKSYYVDKKFAFTKVIWNVKNFCLSKDEEGWRIYSPELEVKGVNLTKWTMILMRDYSEAEKKYVVQFQLNRLRCAGFSGEVAVDCVLVYSDCFGEFIEHDFQHSFRENDQLDKTLLYADLNPIKGVHRDVFELRIEILVYFPDTIEAVPFCENNGIKRLSEDLHNVFENGMPYDLELIPERSPVHAHKAILFHRIKNQEFRNKISSQEVIFVDDFGYEAVDKVVRFLYTGNIQHAVVLPSVGVFTFAEFLDVKPIVAYYNPDEITFTTSFNVEEYCVTWRLDDFLNIKENIVLSPQMTNNAMDARWCLKVYPQGISKKEKSISIYLEIQSETEVYICVELFLAKEGDGHRTSYRNHKLIKEKEKEFFGNKSFIELDKAKAEYMNNGSLTFGLELRIGSGKEDYSFGKSSSSKQYFSVQKNYRRLSEDILSLYETGSFVDTIIDIQHYDTNFRVHKCILRERCSSLLHAIESNELTNHLNDVNVEVFTELINFIYSGQLNENIILEDIFCLYDTANKFSFVALSTVVIERLKELLTESNALTIFEFSDSKSIDDLRDSAWNYIEVSTLDN